MNTILSKEIVPPIGESGLLIIQVAMFRVRSPI